MTADTRTRNSGLSREPDRRSGSDVGRRRVRARGRAVRGVHRRARGARTARRRHLALRRQGRPQGGRNVNGEIARAVVGTILRPARARRGDDRARRYADQGPAGRQCAPRRVDGGAAGRGRLEDAASLPAHCLALSRRRRAVASRADDEHPERRSPRRFERGLPGVHGDAGRGARRSRRRCASAPRSFTRCGAS